VTGDHDHFGGILDFTDFFQGVESIHAGEPDVEQHDVHGPLA
jgi:hypothetical protein